LPDNTLPLEDDGMYHIYNRAVGSEVLFSSNDHYEKFLSNIRKYLLPHLDIWSYCLLPNHFHLLVKLKPRSRGAEVSKAISDCCNSYSKWLNNATRRKGNLFMRPFKRKKIIDDPHLAWTAWYIHRNPMHHHLARHYGGWKYSSYKVLTSDRSSSIACKDLIGFFGGVTPYLEFHGKQEEIYSEWF
jgi:REP element-mobilizing transposase RayT